MGFTIDESFLPATLTSHPMTDEQFSEFCAEHPDLFFEMTAEGQIIVMAPTFSESSMRNSEITGQLITWARKDARGKTFDSSGGFVLPNGARRSADAAWIEIAKVNQLRKKGGFFHLCPDFVIELKSETDRIKTLRAKMHEWIANGALLGWLINPDNETVEVYRPNREPETLSALTSIAGETPVQGFLLDLKAVWIP